MNRMEQFSFEVSIPLGGKFMLLKNKWLLFCFMGILGIGGFPTLVIAMKANPVFHRAEKDLGELSFCLERFKEDIGRYPDSQEGLIALSQRPLQIDPLRWKGSYISLPPRWTDPWDQNYQYLSPGIHDPKAFDLFSLGRDGVEGTPDDINNWDSKQSWRTYYRTHPTIPEILNRYLEPRLVISIGLGFLIYFGFKFLIWLFKLFARLFKLFSKKW